MYAKNTMYAHAGISLTESHLSAITVSYDQITEVISLLKSRCILGYM